MLFLVDLFEMEPILVSDLIVIDFFLVAVASIFLLVYCLFICMPQKKFLVRMKMVIFSLPFHFEVFVIILTTHPLMLDIDHWKIFFEEIQKEIGRVSVLFTLVLFVLFEILTHFSLLETLLNHYEVKQISFLQVLNWYEYFNHLAFLPFSMVLYSFLGLYFQKIWMVV